MLASSVVSVVLGPVVVGLDCPKWIVVAVRFPVVRRGTDLGRTLERFLVAGLVGGFGLLGQGWAWGGWVVVWGMPSEFEDAVGGAVGGGEQGDVGALVLGYPAGLLEQADSGAGQVAVTPLRSMVVGLEERRV